MGEPGRGKEEKERGKEGEGRTIIAGKGSWEKRAHQPVSPRPEGVRERKAKALKSLLGKGLEAIKEKPPSRRERRARKIYW